MFKISGNYIIAYFGILGQIDYLCAQIKRIKGAFAQKTNYLRYATERT